MPEIQVSEMKCSAQMKMLRNICKQISELPDDWLGHNAEGLLGAIVGTLDEQSQEDAWGTEGWQHFFGYE